MHLLLKTMLDYVQRRPVTAADIFAACGLVVTRDFGGLGDTSASHKSGLVSFLSDLRFLQSATENANIDAVFCKNANELSSLGKLAIACEDPKKSFFDIVSARANGLFDDFPSHIESDVGSSGVEIAKTGVLVGTGVTIEPNVTIHSGVAIASGAIIRAGAVLGLDSFQHQRSARGLYSVRHDGALLIEADAEIGANSCLSRGFSYRSTVVGRNTKLDAQCYVGHGAAIGDESIICAGSKIMGHCEIGNGVFLGPGSMVSSRIRIEDQARVAIGSVVTQDVAVGQRVAGNFAVPHEKWIEFVKGVR